MYQQEPGWQIQFLTDAGQTSCFWVPAYRALICSLALNNEYCFYAISIVNVLQMSYNRNAKIDCTCTGGTERETKMTVVHLGNVLVSCLTAVTKHLTETTYGRKGSF